MGGGGEEMYFKASLVKARKQGCQLEMRGPVHCPSAVVFLLLTLTLHHRETEDDLCLNPPASVTVSTPYGNLVHHPFLHGPLT